MASKRLKWWSKMVDIKEAKNQMLFSIPITITIVAYYLIPIVSIMFAGHLGELELAASTLAQSWIAVTGYSLMIGLSGALDTLCGQAYGASQYKMLGIYLQANCIISFIFSIVMSILWFFSDTILVLLHHDEHISAKAGIYLKFFTPGIFAYSLLYNLLKFLQAQSVVKPLVLHIGIAYVLVRYTSLGFKAAPLANSISMCFSVVILSVYVLRSERFKQTWGGFSFESFSHIVPNLKLALPSAGMVCLEYWAFHILVLLAGLMPNSKITTSLVALCVNIAAVAFMISYGLSAAASTRVANELGAGNSESAKNALVVNLKLCILLALLVDLALGLGRRFWPGLFSNSSTIINRFASLTPLLLLSIPLDYVQAVLSGVARGCGLQSYVLFINLASYYLIGMVISCILGFKLKLHAKGLWVGLICGLAFQVGGLIVLTLRIRWSRTNRFQTVASPST